MSAQGSRNDDWTAVLARMFEKSRRADVTADEAAPYDGFMTGKHSQPFFREIGWDSPERPLAARRAQVVTTDGILVQTVTDHARDMFDHKIIAAPFFRMRAAVSSVSAVS
ncbi:hypothetical protein [Bradyrhizobium diversitatis]|uniref:Uncharacterized protein n=1 Tax=Bradyrhizobium diversitatis TaxID=2755406 RepID=A0ABS0NZK7_9BRAD|nr:hypothetical protein [Bradyrhizobium diversitatis]MBH5386282.1 hypothetical protein [Bradyrhizobium diversitatis]